MSKSRLLVAISILIVAAVALIGSGIALFSTKGDLKQKISAAFNTATPMPTETSITIATSTPVVEPTLEVTATPTPVVFNYPESYYITDITGHRQFYSLACEASAAVDWAKYFGVSFHEYTFQVGLPLSDNPDYGFVGDVNAQWGQIPPYGYGVYSGPVATELNEYGLPAKGVKNYTLDELKQKVSESKPVIVWVIGNMEWSEPVNYTDTEGRTVVVAPFEHVVIITGYNTDSIRYMTNGKFYDVPTEVFLRSWGVLEYMAVYYDE